jgi:small-conductance mechanosensitive channel
VRGSKPYLSDRQRWWISGVRNAALILGLALLARLWAQEISDAALSLAAVAVALVIATKELLLCLTGAIWRQVAGPFSIGDWVEIGPLSGEVIETNPMSVVLQEIDREDFQLTGRLVTVPNSQLLSLPVVNNSFRKRFTFLTFALHAEPGLDALAARRMIVASLTEASSDFAETARRYVARIERMTGAPLPDPQPRVTLATTDLAKIVLRVTVFCPRETAPAMREAAMEALLRASAPATDAAAPVRAVGA